ncbi:MAG TPA: hypothetical protein VGP90_05780, partial [Acidimicrobiia bacterium]|nr:hypothetical protein [Acidimicrobiia bacterium]
MGRGRRRPDGRGGPGAGGRPPEGSGALGSLPEGGYRVDDLFDLVRRAWPYRDLTRAEFDEVLEM